MSYGITIYWKHLVLFHLSVRPSIRPSVRPFVCSSVRPFVRPFVRPSVRPSVPLPVRPSIGPSFHLFFHLSVHLFVHPSVFPSIHPSVQPPAALGPEPVVVSNTLCPAVHISGSQNVYSRAEGIADHYCLQPVCPSVRPFSRPSVQSVYPSFGQLVPTESGTLLAVPTDIHGSIITPKEEMR